MRKFNNPHKRIHKVAIHVAEFINNGEQDKAMDLIADTHNNELAEMINLFSKFITITAEQAKKEITIVLENERGRSAIAVDSILAVEKLAQDSVVPMPDFADVIDRSLTTCIAKSSKDNSLIILLDAQAIIQEAKSV